MPSRANRSQERGSATLALVGGAAAFAGVVTAVMGVTPVLQPWSFADAAATSSFVSSGANPAAVQPVGGSHDAATGTPTSITLGIPSAAGGARVSVSGEGFGPGESVVIRFDTDELAKATADADGRFADVHVTIPDDYGAFAPASFTITASGAASSHSAEAPFRLIS